MIEKYEKEIPLGIVACTPGRMALVKFEAGVYARVYVRENKVVPNPEPYNLAFHGIDYMKKNNIIVSEEEKKKIMDFVNANKDAIYADCREQAAYEEDEDYEE